MTEKNKRLAVAGAAAMLTFLLLSAVVVKPAFRKIKDIDAQRNSLSEKGPLLRSVLDAETRLEAYKKFMTTDRDLSPIIQELASMAEKSSLRVASISPDKDTAPAHEGDIEKLSINIEAEGSFHKLGGFISQVENLDRFVKISRIDFGHGVLPDPNIKKVTLVVSMFYLPKEATLA